MKQCFYCDELVEDDELCGCEGEIQAISFAYGNAVISNPDVTLEDAEKAVKDLRY